NSRDDPPSHRLDGFDPMTASTAHSCTKGRNKLHSRMIYAVKLIRRRRLDWQREFPLRRVRKQNRQLFSLASTRPIDSSAQSAYCRKSTALVRQLSLACHGSNAVF